MGVWVCSPTKLKNLKKNKPKAEQETAQPTAAQFNKTKWFWSESCEAAFLWTKELLLCDQVLVCYDPSKPLILSVDAGPQGIGAVLSHTL